MEMAVDVWLYGPLSLYAGDAAKKHHAKLSVELPRHSRIRDLLTHLSLPTEERGITFINGNLCAMPGLQPDLDHELFNGDRIAFFHLKSMFPFQYRDGAARTPDLSQAMDQGAKLFHHSVD